MESFVVYETNKACREKDFSKIDTLGPFAYALALILGHAQKNRDDADKL
jgi:hypothetical protein